MSPGGECTACGGYYAARSALRSLKRLPENLSPLHVAREHVALSEVDAFASPVKESFLSIAWRGALQSARAQEFAPWLAAKVLIWTAAAALWHVLPTLVEAGSLGYVIDGASGEIVEIEISRAAVAARIPTHLVSEPRDVRISPDGRRAYVSGTVGVSVVDTAADALVDTITVPGCAYSECSITGFDITDDGALLYIATFDWQPSSPHNAVTVIDVATHGVVASVPLGQTPQDVALGSNARAYVALSSKSVAVVDTVTETVTGTIALSEPAVALAVSPTGRALYVATEGGRERTMVSVIDTETNTVIANIPVALGALGIAISPNGARVYVASIDNTVSVIDTTTNAVIAAVGVSTPERVAVSPDGASVYVSNVGTGTVSILDTATNRVVGGIEVGQAPLGIAFTPDGSIAYVANYNSGDLRAIDTAARTVRSVIHGGIWLRHITVRPDGRFAYVTTFAYLPGTELNGSGLLVVDLAAHRVAARVALDSGGDTLAVSPDGAVVYVLGSHLAVVDTATNVVARTILLPDLDPPSALGLSPDGTYAFVAGRVFSGSGGERIGAVGLLRIDAVTGAIATSLTYPGDGTPVDLAVSPDGRFAYVAVEPPPQLPPHRWYPTPRPTAAGVLVWDIERQQVVGRIPIGRPQSVAWLPDGRVAYVANGSQNVAVIDAVDHQILSMVPVGVAQQRIAVTRDGRFAPFVSFGSTIGVIDIASGSVTAMLAPGGQPEDIAIGPNNGEACHGDCNVDGHVTIDEVILGVNIALGRAELTECPSADDDASGSVGVDELVGAVSAALDKCRA